MSVTSDAPRMCRICHTDLMTHTEFALGACAQVHEQQELNERLARLREVRNKRLIEDLTDYGDRRTK